MDQFACGGDVAVRIFDGSEHTGSPFPLMLRGKSSCDARECHWVLEGPLVHAGIIEESGGETAGRGQQVADRR